MSLQNLEHGFNPMASVWPGMRISESADQDSDPMSLQNLERGYPRPLLRNLQRRFQNPIASVRSRMRISPPTAISQGHDQE
jgi:hypothetical protein